MRVLVVTSSFPRFPEDSSGVFILSLCKELQKLGIDIEVMAPHDSGCKRNENWGGIGVFRFPYFYPLRFQKLCYGAGALKNMKESPLAFAQLPFFLFAQFCYALQVAREKKFDLVHAHWSIPQGLTGLLLRRSLGIPCVTSLHGSDVHGLGVPIIRGMNKKVILGSDACTANSKATATVAHDVSGRRDISVIPMGVNVEFFKPSCSRTNVNKKNGPNILYAGRLIEVKGVRYLIEAIPSVLKMHPRAKLTIIGSGPLKRRLLDLSDRLHLEDRVQFIDPVPQEDLLSHYSKADVFVLPSVVTDAGEKEGLGVVLLEAMACRVPVIGSAIGGIPDIIRDQETGLLVRQKSPSDLAEKINRVLADEGLRQRLTDRGRDFVGEHFSWSVVGKSYLKLFRSVLEEERRGGRGKNESRC